METISDLVATVLVLVAAMIDVHRHRIPNVLTISGAVLGMTLAAAHVSDLTASRSIVGFGIGLLLMLPGHALGATGAGDVKLLAAVGALTGPERVTEVFLYTAIAGGTLAVLYATVRGRLGITLRQTAALVCTPRQTRPAIEAADRNNRFPYGPAIAVGTIAALWRM